MLRFIMTGRPFTSTLRHELVAHDLGGRTIVRAAVTRNVDDAPLGGKGEFSKRWPAWARAAPTAVQLYDVRGRLGNLFQRRTPGTVDDRPVDHDGLEVRARPLRVADRDAPVLAREDGVDDPVVG